MSTHHDAIPAGVLTCETCHKVLAIRERKAMVEFTGDDGRVSRRFSHTGRCLERLIGWLPPGCVTSVLEYSAAPPAHARLTRCGPEAPMSAVWLPRIPHVPAELIPLIDPCLGRARDYVPHRMSRAKLEDIRRRLLWVAEEFGGTDSAVYKRALLVTAVEYARAEMLPDGEGLSAPALPEGSR